MVSLAAAARAAAEPTWADQLFEAAPELAARAEEWVRRVSPTEMVGSAHHTNPRSHLARFARNDQLRVRDRVTGHGRIETINRVGAIKDFYTFINIDGTKDGRLEQILSIVEADANEIFARLISPFHRPRPLTASEQMHIATYLALQVMRTPRHRREEELMTDYTVRTQHRDQPGIRNLEVVPTPNQHLKYMCRSLPLMTRAFLGRPITIVTLDAPLFITCDDPVIGLTDTDHVIHLPSCAKNTRRRRKDARKPSRNRSRNADILHIYPTHPPAAATPQAALTLSSYALLVVGPQGEFAGDPTHLTGAGAEEAAALINARLAGQAYGWVAAHPDHPTFMSMNFPEPGPLMNVCDGGTAIAARLTGPPSPRNPALLGRRR